MPETLDNFKSDFPETWAAYIKLRDACDGEGPLDRKTTELIKIGISAALGHEGGLVAHISQARRAGAADAEIYHAILVSTGLAGFSSTLGATSVAREYLNEG